MQPLETKISESSYKQQPALAVVGQ